MASILPGGRRSVFSEPTHEGGRVSFEMYVEPTAAWCDGGNGTTRNRARRSQHTLHRSQAWPVRLDPASLFLTMPENSSGCSGRGCFGGERASWASAEALRFAGGILGVRSRVSRSEGSVLTLVGRAVAACWRCWCWCSEPNWL